MILDPEAKAAVLAGLISFRFEGGPLDGRQVLYTAPPEPLEKPVLREQRRFDKERNIDVVARGWYRLERREIVQPVVEVAVMAEVEEGAESTPPPEQPAPQFEFLAVNIPSDDDQEWTPYVPPAPDELPAPEKREAKEISVEEVQARRQKFEKFKAMMKPKQEK